MKSVIRLLLQALGRLPLPLLHATGAALGTLLWWLPNDLKAITLLHLRRCLPELDEPQRRRLARESLRQSMQAVLEAPAIWFGPEARLRRWIDVPALRDQIQEASRQGAIILCPHIGSWELAGMFCAAHGGIASLYKPQKGVIDELILEGRSRLGATLVPTSAAGVRALLQELKGGGKIGVLPDHDPPAGSGVFAPLFGIPAHTTVLVSKLAGRIGLPVWFCYAERMPRGRGFRFHLRQAPEGVADAAQGPAALNQGIESVIRHLPEQYWWSYKRYRRRPPGGENLYAGL
ncbi:hypothetical protein D0B54_00515 [Solimonas sp. K1W22B-7]|uniref:lysophospholipid acyltransferase family protein n=1 Tax=Solimonas sp. K1W22B-7 TaxID=2303331 RepID=UPI000E337AA9|nr:lysophospholipid acyltransferase family protein [Solimonas sp. K1W22B-7]AXQ27261.1 hypothetical protein D0B54_00515 [Solimonas sp. K1W22B-7]